MTAPLPHLLLFGASGRMGTAIARIATERGIGWTSANDGDLPHTRQDSATVVVDFSGPGEAERALARAVDLGCPFVSGTTGLGEEWDAALARSAATIPVLWASNMGVGVAVLHHLARQAARMLPGSWDIEIVELHHRRKQDSPSGTALTLAAAAREGRDSTPDALSVRTAREGQVGPRPAGEIGVFGIRGGEIVGEHTVYLIGDEERIEITHRAATRDLFAAGAVEAALWLHGQAPGRYTIDDMLGAG